MIIEINKDIAYTSEKPIVYLCIKKINDNHINNILDTYYHGNVEYDSKTKLRNYKSYKNKTTYILNYLLVYTWFFLLT